MDETPRFSFTAQPQGFLVSQNTTHPYTQNSNYSQKMKTNVVYPVNEEHFKTIVSSNTEANENLINLPHQNLALEMNSYQEPSSNVYNTTTIDHSITQSSHVVQGLQNRDTIGTDMPTEKFNTPHVVTDSTRLSYHKHFNQQYHMPDMNLRSTTTSGKGPGNRLSELSNQLPQDSFQMYTNLDNRRQQQNLASNKTPQDNHIYKVNKNYDTSDIQSRLRPESLNQSSKIPSATTQVLYNPNPNVTYPVNPQAVASEAMSKEKQTAPNPANYSYSNQQIQISEEKFLPPQSSTSNSGADNSFLARLLTNSNVTNESRRYQQQVVHRYYGAKPVPIAPAQNKVQMNIGSSVENLKYDWSRTSEPAKAVENVMVSFNCIT